ncbi:putative OB-fold protein [Spinactinospora alkalitolerans]|uniref:Putative OB-fold protein n=1 Tax=Spinactinospora alkalitolerans TaxID=687207 RepID=A0A852U9E3_9ACTN|nr:putative OB-fold protein [Spinactinospora alkalitolerans]
MPYTLALVDLEEGFRMLSRVVDEADEDTPVDAQLRVRWEHSDGVTLPLFFSVDRGTDR